MDNHNAILYQKRIKDLTSKINKESNYRKENSLRDQLESAIDLFDLELQHLPQEGKQLDQSGNLIPWEK